MPKYLIKASYTREGVEGVRSKGGTSRRDAVTKAIEGLGGSVESFYFAFGDHDVYVTADLPDDEAAIATALNVNAAGGATTKTTVLFTPEQVDAAAKRTVDYRAPGA
ncbi:MAG TPA: GYD domain-containing protein [Solirubrobacteraceae bacterium]|nr:GYD domain-containing protein [Solirubrobacteraceae bacterium]